MTNQGSGWHPVGKGLRWLFVILRLCVWGAVELHIAAALWHHFVQKDNTLTRMLPQR